MPEPVHLPERIEADAQRLLLELMVDDTRKFVVQTDTQEYADGVLKILESMYPGASDRVRIDVVGRWPGTTG